MMPNEWAVGIAAPLIDAGTPKAVAAALPGRGAEGHAKMSNAAFSGGAIRPLEAEES